MSETDIQQRLQAGNRQYLDSTILTEGNLFPDIYRTFLEYLEWLKRDLAEAEELRLARLDSQLRHAAAQVPAYRGLDPQAGLAHWPLTGKADLRDRLADYCDDAIDISRCRASFSSGTAGIPLRAIHDFDHIVHNHALALRRNHVAGLPLRRRILIPMRDGALPWIEYASPAYGNSIVAQFGSVGEDGRFTDAITRAASFGPDVIFGHPSGCLLFAESLRACALTVRPRLVLTMGEKLSRAVRDELESQFCSPVVEGYGMNEVGTIAVQCARRRFHVEQERVLVEIIDDAGQPVPPGQPGEIVVTDLINRAMPLIRYRTGDVATLTDGRCDCGYPGELLADIEGRDHGMLILDGGRIAVPVIALTRVARLQRLRRFQFIRRAPAQIEVLISVLDGASAAVVTRQLTADLRTFLQDAAAVEVRLAGDADFLPSMSGKDTDYVSLV